MEASPPADRSRRPPGRRVGSRRRARPSPPRHTLAAPRPRHPVFGVEQLPTAARVDPFVRLHDPSVRSVRGAIREGRGDGEDAGTSPCMRPCSTDTSTTTSRTICTRERTGVICCPPTPTTTTTLRWITCTSPTRTWTRSIEEKPMFTTTAARPSHPGRSTSEAIKNYWAGDLAALGWPPSADGTSPSSSRTWLISISPSGPPSRSYREVFGPRTESASEEGFLGTAIGGPGASRPAFGQAGSRSRSSRTASPQPLRRAPRPAPWLGPSRPRPWSR
jgi:hypothetical protein